VLLSITYVVARWLLGVVVVMLGRQASKDVAYLEVLESVARWVAWLTIRQSMSVSWA